MINATQGQGADGRPHLTYFRADVQRSYVWDGRSMLAEVHVDGYGGDLAAFVLVPVLGPGATLAEHLEAFQRAADRDANAWEALALSYGRSLVWWGERVGRVDGLQAAARWLLGATVGDVTACLGWLGGVPLPEGWTWEDGEPVLRCTDEEARSICRRANVPAHARLNLEGACLAYRLAVVDAWRVALRCDLAGRQTAAQGGAK